MNDIVSLQGVVDLAEVVEDVVDVEAKTKSISSWMYYSSPIADVTTRNV